VALILKLKTTARLRQTIRAVKYISFCKDTQCKYKPFDAHLQGISVNIFITRGIYDI
jgi:hypothetical protein